MPLDISKDSEYRVRSYPLKVIIELNDNDIFGIQENYLGMEWQAGDLIGIKKFINTTNNQEVKEKQLIYKLGQKSSNKNIPADYFPLLYAEPDFYTGMATFVKSQYGIFANSLYCIFNQGYQKGSSTPSCVWTYLLKEIYKADIIDFIETDYVHTFGDETINGIKTFTATQGIRVNAQDLLVGGFINDNLIDQADYVHTFGDETINGIKTFTATQGIRVNAQDLLVGGKLNTALLPPLAIIDTIFSNQTSLANYIANEWTNGSIQQGDVVQIIVPNPPNPSDVQFYMLTTGNGSNVNQYIRINQTTIDWLSVLNKPTTLAGYGITDAYTKTEVDANMSFFVGLALGNYNINVYSTWQNLALINGYIGEIGNEPKYRKSTFERGIVELTGIARKPNFYNNNFIANVDIGFRPNKTIFFSTVFFNIQSVQLHQVLLGIGASGELYISFASPSIPDTSTGYLYLSGLSYPLES